MSLRRLLDSLAEFIREDLKSMELPVKDTEFSETVGKRSPEVYRQRMPSASDAEEAVPYILLQMLNGADKRSAGTGERSSTAEIRAIVVTYEQDPEEGALSLINIIERLRQDLETVKVIGGSYKLIEPFEWLFYEDDTMPYHIAEFHTVWEIPTVEPFVPGLHDLKW